MKFVASIFFMPQPALVLETSWEVCNRVGGIYTVLRTKAQSMVSRFGDNYVAVGPYDKRNAYLEFEQSEPPEFAKTVLRGYFEEGSCHWGRWLIPGEPQVFLLDFSSRRSELNAFKHALWQDEHISTIQPDALVDTAVIFGFLAGELITRLADQGGRQIIVHAHEWLAGIALLRAARSRNVKTIFTTHATLVGRYEAGNNPNFYRQLKTIDADERAAFYGIASRHQIEKSAARKADLMTTVSDVTGHEADVLLGRPADAILPNGFNAQRFTTLHEFQNLHAKFKQRIHQFTMGHFFPSYSFSLDRTLYIFTSGRYEYRNKGMDIFIDALAELNRRLKAMIDPPTVVAFIVTNAETTNIKAEVLKGRLMFHDLQGLVDDLNHQIGEVLLRSLVNRKMPEASDLLPPKRE